MALSRRALLAALASPLMPKGKRNAAWNKFAAAEELLWESIKDIYYELKKFESDEILISVDLIKKVKLGKVRLKAVSKTWEEFEDEISGY